MREVLIGNNRGFSLVEILIALGIFSISITAVITMFFGGQNFVASGISSRTALEKAHDGVEALRFIRDTNWTSMTNGLHGLQLSGGTWQLTGSPDVSDGFTRTVSISSDIDGIKRANVTVSWQETTPSIKTVSIYQTLSPPDQGLQGDWTKPCLLSHADGTSGDKAKDIFFSNYKVYVASSASAANKPDL